MMVSMPMSTSCSYVELPCFRYCYFIYYTKYINTFFHMLFLAHGTSTIKSIHGELHRRVCTNWTQCKSFSKFVLHLPKSPWQSSSMPSHFVLIRQEDCMLLVRFLTKERSWVIIWKNILLMLLYLYCQGKENTSKDIKTDKVKMEI